MNSFYVAKENQITDFLIEKEGFEGVKLIAETVREDLRIVTDMAPEIIEDIGTSSVSSTAKSSTRESRRKSVKSILSMQRVSA